LARIQLRPQDLVSRLRDSVNQRLLHQQGLDRHLHQGLVVLLVLIHQNLLRHLEGLGLHQLNLPRPYLGLVVRRQLLDNKLQGLGNNSNNQQLQDLDRQPNLLQDLDLELLSQVMGILNILATGGFGQPVTTTFGQPAQQQPATTMFGAPAQPAQPSGFGQQQAQPAASGFGQPQATNSLFGQPKPATTAFGGISSFGAPAQPAQSSGFGGFGQQQAQQPAQTASTFGFGAAKPGISRF
jgi:hypothetical protein